jgi:hypothetical protein
LLRYTNGSFQFIGTYVSLTAEEIKKEYMLCIANKKYDPLCMPFAKNAVGSLLCIKSVVKGYDGEVMEWDQKITAVKKVSEHFGYYLEGMRDNLLLKKLKYDAKDGLINK